MVFETLAIATIRQNFFATMYSLINNNKPSGWSVFASYPEDEASFPCIILNSGNIKPTIVGLDKDSYMVEDIKMKVEFYALAKSGDDMIEVGRDNVMNTILTNQATLDTYGLYLKEDAFDDSDVDTFISGKEKIRTAGSIISLGMK